MGVSSRIFSSLFVSDFKYWCARAAGAFRVSKKTVFSIFSTVARKTINVFGKNDYTLLRGGLNSIKKDDSY